MSRRPSWSERLGWCLAALCFAFAGPVDAAPTKSTVSKRTAKAKHHKVKKPARSALLPSSGAGAEESETLLAEIQPQESGESALHGAASYYSYGFHGRRAASGERFDAKAMTAASNRFPLGSWVAVRHLGNDRCVVVRVNDRMHARHRVRIIDLSRGAAEKLRMISAGVAMVRVARLNMAPGEHRDEACESAFTLTKRRNCPVCNGGDEPLALNLSHLPEPIPAPMTATESGSATLAIPSPSPVISP